VLENKIRRNHQVFSNKVRLLAEFLAVTSVNKDGFASSRVAAIDVAPAIPNHETLAKINRKGFGSLEKHAWTRFPAFAGSVAGMVTNFHPINRHSSTHFGVHRLDRFLPLGAATDIRLISGHHEQVTSSLEPPAGFRHFFINLEILDRIWRVWFSIPNDAWVDNAVSIQEHSSMKSAHLNESFPTW
jgi:hypothetical protein